MKKTLFFAGALALIMAGCAASGPTILSKTNTAPGVKFKNFETYNFIQPLGTDHNNSRTPMSNSRTPMSSRLMNSMMREMSELGLRRSDESPELLVDFFVATEEMLGAGQTADENTIRRSHWNQSFSTWPGYQTMVQQYSQGVLIVDVIDTANNALVAEGSAESPVPGSGLTQSQSDEFIRSIVKDIW